MYLNVRKLVKISMALNHPRTVNSYMKFTAEMNHFIKYWFKSLKFCASCCVYRFLPGKCDELDKRGSITKGGRTMSN